MRSRLRGRMAAVIGAGSACVAILLGIAAMVARAHDQTADTRAYAQVAGGSAGQPSGGPAEAGGPGAPLGGPATVAPPKPGDTLDPLAPIEAYRENPFVPLVTPGETTTVGQGYVNGERLVRVGDLGSYWPEGDARIWQDIKRRNAEYFEALEGANFGRRFQWGVTQFPRPRTVLQPKPSGEVPLLLAPVPQYMGGAPVVGPGPGPGPGTTGPRTGVGAQQVGPVGPKVEPKAAASRIRRVAGIVHDGAAAAIVEIDKDGTVTRLLVKPGQTFPVGELQYRVRAIGESEIVLVDVASGNEVRVPLRGAAANEF